LLSFKTETTDTGAETIWASRKAKLKNAHAPFSCTTNTFPVPFCALCDAVLFQSQGAILQLAAFHL
jgi:hypothetical protein